MADNSLRTASGAESIRTIDKSGIKVAVGVIDKGGSGTEDLWTAETLSDTLSRTAARLILGGAVLLDDGSNLVRARGDVTNGLDVDVTRLPASTNTIEVVGDVASGATAAGNPVQVGIIAESTVPSAVSDGQVIRPWGTLEGAQVMTVNTFKTSALVPTIDTAVYADLDRLGSVVTVSNAALRNGGSGAIVYGLLQDDAGSNFSIEANFYAVTPTLANADNGIFDISDANVATAVPLGTIDFWASQTKAYTSNRQTLATMAGSTPYMRYTCASGDSAIYMILRARGAYDAIATDDITIWLELVRF